jgi:FtsP/CotA-like multicopper oxidase with cupredoxin domain
VLVLVPVLAIAAAAAVLRQRAAIDTVGEVEFDRPVAIPPLAQSRDEDGHRVFDLRATAGVTDFGVPGEATETWGYNGSYLGPTLRAQRGDRVRVNVTNALPESTTVHWHGHHLPPEMDGGPHRPVPPGGDWQAEWTIDQPAATTWYHPHPHGVTAEHVYRGLAGMFIIDDPEHAADLPDEYGVDDVPLVVQDKMFGVDGQLTRPNQMLSQVGVLGDTIVVNGTVGGFLPVRTERVRLRLLNASNARVFDFGFADDREFAQVGTDGGLLPAPHHTDRVRLSPGERAEVVVEMAAGERVELRSYPPDLGTDPFTSRFAGGDDRFSVLELRAAERLRQSPRLPERLAEPPDLDPAQATVTRSFGLGETTIDGEAMDMTRIDHVVEVDTTEVWQVHNQTGAPHNFHIHDVQFRVVEVGGREPGPELAGWKDTVYVPPGDTVRLVVRFTDYTDPNVPYMYHCHLLKHEDQGMMGQFVVVDSQGGSHGE